jgi:hypothetical protein
MGFVFLPISKSGPRAGRLARLPSACLLFVAVANDKIFSIIALIYLH